MCAYMKSVWLCEARSGKQKPLLQLKVVILFVTEGGVSGYYGNGVLFNLNISHIDYSCKPK